jgi:hypothetical protein
MMKRAILATASLLALSVAAPQLSLEPAAAHATEINTDVGCDSSGAWMAGTGWSVSGSKCVASSATRMSMLMQNSTAIKLNHVYKVTADVTVTGGELRFFVGLKMNASVPGTDVLESSISAVPDNFTTSLGLTTSSDPVRSTTGPGDDPERNGSMRISCASGGFAHVDSLVWNGISTPHLHEFTGASNIQRNWTYQDFRTKAESSCTNPDDPTHTINRSGYWFPAVLKSDGSPKRTGPMLIYYKGPSSPSQPSSVALTGSISGTTLTVTATGGVTNPISPDGEFITGTGITANTEIISQLSGTTGGIGTYQLNNSMTVSSETITLISPYKAAGETSGTAASMCADFSFAGVCQNVPRGLAFTFGWKGETAANTTTDGNCGPDDTTTEGTSTTERCSIRDVSGGWALYSGPNGEMATNATASISGTTLTVTAGGGSIAVGQYVYGTGIIIGTKITGLGTGSGGTGTYTVNNSQTVSSEALAIDAPGTSYTDTGTYYTLQDIMDLHVAVKGSWAARGLGYPSCWDGTRAMAADHRSNMSWGNNAVACKGTVGAAYPVRLPQISLLLSYMVDQDFVDGGWRLATDEMAYCYDTLHLAGCTEHGDYWEAWSDSVRDTWYAHCNNAHNSCTNDLGDGTSLKAHTKNFDGTDNGAPIFGAKFQQNGTEPPEPYGESHTIKTSGTYTFYITAIDDGVWGFLGMKNFSGTLDNIHVTDMGAHAKGPVTIH